MGNIVIENIKVMDMISGQIIQDPDYLSSIQIEEEEDQEAFYIFLYCASALRVSTFKLPYDANDLDGYQLTQVPDCRHCDFKNSTRWEENTSNEKQLIEAAFDHPTLLYKKLNKRGQLINTTYLEMLKSHKISYNCDSTLFASGFTQKCTHCDD